MSLVSAAGPWRRFGLVVALLAFSACGSSSPTTPEIPVPVATGPQVLRITFQGPSSGCSSPDGRPFAPIIYTRVIVTRSGSEWITASASPDAGNLELRFYPTGRSIIAGSMPIGGTIRGTAIHVPDVLPGLPAFTTRVNFGSDGRTTLDGFAYSANALVPGTGVSGIGSGTVSVSDNDGRSCAGSAFTWGLGPQA